MHGVGEGPRRVGAVRLEGAGRIQIVEDERNVVRVRGSDGSAALSFDGALPVKAVGPDRRAAPSQGFHEPHARHAENDVALDLGEHVARRRAPVCSAVGFGQIGRKPRVDAERLHGGFVHLGDEAVGNDVVPPLGTGGARDHCETLARAGRDGVHGTHRHEVVAHIRLEERDVAVGAPGPRGVLREPARKRTEGRKAFIGHLQHGFAGGFAADGVADELRGLLCLGCIPPLGDGRRALNDGTRQQPLRVRRGDHVDEVCPARRLTEGRDLVGVAAEGRDVGLDPSQAFENIAVAVA